MRTLRHVVTVFGTALVLSAQTAVPDHVLAAGRMPLQEFVDRAAAALGSIVLVGAEATAAGAHDAIEIPERIDLRVGGADDTCSRLLAAAGFALTVLDADLGIYEVVRYDGQRRAQVTMRSEWLSPEHVLQHAASSMPTITRYRLCKLGTAEALRALEPLLRAEDGRECQLRACVSNDSSSLLLQGPRNQVAAALRTLAEAEAQHEPGESCVFPAGAIPLRTFAVEAARWAGWDLKLAVDDPALATAALRLQRPLVLCRRSCEATVSLLLGSQGYALCQVGEPGTYVVRKQDLDRSDFTSERTTAVAPAALLTAAGSAMPVTVQWQPQQTSGIAILNTIRSLLAAAKLRTDRDGANLVMAGRRDEVAFLLRLAMALDVPLAPNVGGAPR
jgi:hypothetical protein